MMPYIVGIDPDTNEYLVGDRRDNVFILRGTDRNRICDLVQLANERAHELQPPEDTEPPPKKPQKPSIVKVKGGVTLPPEDTDGK